MYFVHQDDVFIMFFAFFFFDFAAAAAAISPFFLSFYLSQTVVFGEYDAHGETDMSA